MAAQNAGVPWKEIVFDRSTDPGWKRQKSITPYKCLPVVYETTSSGVLLEISEVLPVERYLVDKFGLAGSDPWERFQVEQAVSSIESSQLMYHYKVLLPNWPSAGAVDLNENKMKRQQRAENANRYYETGLKNFVDIHEEKLQENGGRGGNGHYVGGRASLADIRAIELMDRLMLLRPEGANPCTAVKGQDPKPVASSRSGSSDPCNCSVERVEEVPRPGRLN